MGGGYPHGGGWGWPLLDAVDVAALLLAAKVGGGGTAISSPIVAKGLPRDISDEVSFAPRW